MTLKGRKIGTILIGVVILPMVVYTLIGIKQSQENEAMIAEIYNRQLDAILFSINQYSSDLLTGMSNKLEYVDPFSDPSLNTFINNYKILGCYINRTDANRDTLFVQADQLQVGKILDSLRTEENMVKDRLIRYRQSDFRKIETIPVNANDDFLVIAFVTEPEEGKYIYYEMALEPSYFLTMFVKPKIQQAADNGFVVGIRHVSTGEVLYQTGEPQNEDIYARPLWFFRDYLLEISLWGESMTTIAKRRTRTNLILISMVLIVLVIGVWLVVRNIEREMRLAQAKSDFVSNVSHEIRTPLSLISMFAETLLLGRVTSEEKKLEYYHIINKEATRLRNIVNKILNFAQIEANKKQYHIAPCDLNETIREVVSVYSFHLTNKGFAYEVTYHDGPLPLKADSEAISEALINLLDNAIKYSTDTKRIIISSGKTGDAVYVLVQDFGKGIPSKAMGHIFDKFYRITDGDIYNVQGAGLGLSIVKSIMDAHNGKVEVESKLGEGSCFRLVFGINRQME